MATQRKPPSKWGEARESVAAAREIAARYEHDQVHPDSYLPPSSDDPIWDDLLSRIK